MRWDQPVQYASLSDIGFRRRNNEDCCGIHICPDRETWKDHGHLFLVADGMGGHAVGELASKIAADTIPHTYFKSRESDQTQSLRESVEQANANIHERGTQNHDFARMGTTCTALSLTPRGVVIGHVGDSRAYRVRGNRIDQLTFDHSLQWEMIRSGRMKPEEAMLREPRNIITRSLGPEARVQVDVEGPYHALPGDTYVLCSDGLTAHLEDSEIGVIARELPPSEACRLLVHMANLRGGSDNVTVVVVRVGDLPPGASPEESLDDPEVEGGIGWGWLAGMWGVALSFVGGISSGLLGHLTAGVSLTTVALLGGLAMLILWLRKRRSQPGSSPGRGDTTLWRPYRSSSAGLTRKMLSHLAAVGSELQRTACEEGWTIEGERHQHALQQARTAIAAGQNSEAFSHFAVAIDALMVGVHTHRRQAQHEAKWGRSATAHSSSTRDD